MKISSVDLAGLRDKGHHRIYKLVRFVEWFNIIKNQLDPTLPVDERIQSAHNLNHVFSNDNSEIVKKNYKINNTDILIYSIVYKQTKNNNIYNLLYNRKVSLLLMRHISSLWVLLLKNVKKYQICTLNLSYWDINTHNYTTALNDTMYIDFY